MTIKIASWNVNSLRVRLAHILAWLKEHQPDILALQETKIIDELFPLGAFQEAGYHAVFTGQKTYNGVALISKTPLSDIQKDIPALNQQERRVLGGCLKNIRIWNVYVPNGESVESQKYQYKLAWLSDLKNFLASELRHHQQLIVLGDFNIAPEARDVYDPQICEGHVLCSQAEREQLNHLLALGLEDCFRLHHPTDKNYTWWDYRVNAFKRNMGLRIDHIFVSSLLGKKSIHCYIDKTPRSWERPSDHVPIVAEFHE